MQILVFKALRHIYEKKSSFPVIAWRVVLVAETWASYSSYFQFFFKNGPFPASFFLYFRLFSTVDRKKCSLYLCLDSNCGPLVSDATALRTEPQPLPSILNTWPLIKLLFYFMLKTFCFNSAHWWWWWWHQHSPPKYLHYSIKQGDLNYLIRPRFFECQLMSIMMYSLSKEEKLFSFYQSMNLRN